MHISLRALGFFLASLLLVTACGQKGPLFLPGDPSEVRAIPPQQQPADEDDEDDDTPINNHN